MQHLCGLLLPQLRVQPRVLHTCQVHSWATVTSCPVRVGPNACPLEVSPVSHCAGTLAWGSPDCRTGANRLLLFTSHTGADCDHGPEDWPRVLLLSWHCSIHCQGSAIPRLCLGSQDPTNAALHVAGSELAFCLCLLFASPVRQKLTVMP